MTNEQLPLALRYVQDHHDSIIEEIVSFVAIPSISTDPKARPDSLRAANWLADRLKGLRFRECNAAPDCRSADRNWRTPQSWR